MTTLASASEGVAGPTLRPARPDELEACAEIWRVAINDYIGRLNQPEVPSEVAPLLRLYGHLQATDPERFVVAVEDGQPIAFASAVQRERLWFLSMCFVMPGLQGGGLGRRLLDAVAPSGDAAGGIRATATDSAQPISNALYASLGIVPRIPLLNLIGLPERGLDAFGTLPSGVRAVPFETVVGEAGGSGAGHQQLATTIDAIDRELLGVAHPVDHRFLRTEGRRGWLLVGPDGDALGYGYGSEAGRIGPIAVRDVALLAPTLGFLMDAIQPRGAFALWIPGTADRAVVPLLGAGLRLDPFPILLCWDEGFADFSRYLPISPGLL